MELLETGKPDDTCFAGCFENVTALKFRFLNLFKVHSSQYRNWECHQCFFLFSSFPSFHSLYFLLFLFCWCDFLPSETPAKTPFRQMVAIFSQLDFKIMVRTVLLFEVSFYYYYPIAEFEINPQTYLTTPKLRNCIFFQNIQHTSLTKKKSPYIWESKVENLYKISRWSRHINYNKRMFTYIYCIN